MLAVYVNSGPPALLVLRYVILRNVAGGVPLEWGQQADTPSALRYSEKARWTACALLSVLGCAES